MDCRCSLGEGLHGSSDDNRFEMAVGVASGRRLREWQGKGASIAEIEEFG